ncbi:MAG: HEAT repeat domain-containing protein [Planctomycetales bacterium]|nr:HEAT repeat domain-containing protein [Planctomycetales bacterium]
MHRSIAVFALVLISSITSFARAQDEENRLVKMVVDLLNGDDDSLRPLAYEQIRSGAPGEPATQKFAEQLESVPAAARAGLLSALADRGDASAAPAVRALVHESKDAETRLAAIAAIGKLGNADDCKTLASILLEEDADAVAAARRSLTVLQDSNANHAIVEELNQTGSSQLKVALIEVLTDRRALEKLPTIMIYAVRNDAQVRTAAMAALGELGDASHVSGMVRGVLKAASGKERAEAEKQVMFVCNRIEDKDRRAEPIINAMKRLSSAQQTILLSTLGRVGGPLALAELEKAYGSSSSSVHTAGLRAIANWPDASIADRLIEIAKQDKHKDHQRIARMALLRIAPLPDGRTDQEKLELLQKGMELAASTSEKTYALKRAAAIRLIETLRWVEPYLDDEHYSQQACATIVELAHHRQLRDDNKPEFHAALDRVIELSKDKVVVDRANRYKRGETWVRPK